MPDREKVIKGLECCVTMPDIYPSCEESPYADADGTCANMNGLHRDALVLLKAQEPRLMTVDEVRTWVSVPRIDREPIWVETENSVNAWIVSNEYWDMPIDVNLSSDLYGKTWRCWTSRPTDEQREKEPWNGCTDVT